MNVADIFEHYCAVSLLLFSNEMVHKINAIFVYLFRKKPKRC